MDRRAVQGIFTILDPEKSRSLLKRLITETFDFTKLSPGSDQAVLTTIRHHVLRELVANAGYVLQQIQRRGIEFDTYPVHTRFNHGRKAALQFPLVDIMLILTNADRFRLRLHQFCQWILE